MFSGRFNPTLLSLAWVCLLGLSACGGGGGGSSEPVNYPECEPGMVTIQGTLDGEEIRYDLEFSVYSFVNFGEGELSVDGRTNEGEWSLGLAFAQVMRGQTIAATGWLDLSDIGGPELGNCATGSKTSSITDIENGSKFILRDLHEDPYCVGAPVEGTLYGCADNRDPPFPCGELTCTGEQYCAVVHPGAVMAEGEATTTYTCIDLPEGCVLPGCRCLERAGVECTECEDRGDPLICTTAAP